MNSERPFIYQRRELVNMAKHTNIPIVIEMYKGHWCDELEEYSVRDLAVEGKLNENPSMIKSSEKTRRALEMNWYILHPINAEYFIEKSDKRLSNYVYIADDENGKMKVVARGASV